MTLSEKTCATRNILRTVLSFVVLTAAALAVSPTVASAQRDTGPVTLKFFGLHRRLEDPWPAVPFGSWRVTVAWKNAEPEKGVWDFKTADQEVEQATQHGVDLVVDIGFVPTWASSTPDRKCMVGM